MTAVVSAAPSVAPAAAKPKPRVAAPRKITFHEFEGGKVTVSWSRVKGIKRYQFHAYKIDPKLGGFYPFNVVQGSNYKINTTHLSYTFVNNFTPLRDTKRINALPWTITVLSITPNKSHRSSVAKAPTFRVKDKIVYKTVVIKKKPTAKQVRGYKSVVKKCLAIGAGAAVSTAVGGGSLAVLATWVPGLNAVSWTAVAALTVTAGLGGTLGCFVTEKINPGSSLHLRVL